jgi:hypothetical protein
VVTLTDFPFWAKVSEAVMLRTSVTNGSTFFWERESSLVGRVSGV